MAAFVSFCGAPPDPGFEILDFGRKLSIAFDSWVFEGASPAHRARLSPLAADCLLAASSCLVTAGRFL